MTKVLATIVFAVYTFINQYPSAWVYAIGSTLSRTRLYKMHISKYILKAEFNFDVFGHANDEWVRFMKMEFMMRF